MCAVPLGDADHSHLVDLDTRRLMCACRPCYLLFTDEHAHLRYRAIPDRYLAVDSPDLEIPVGLAFLFRNSAQDRMVLFYPGPAGATESELDIALPSVEGLRPDVEALLIRQGQPAYIVPIDACYELIGGIRRRWQGFSGGDGVRDEIERFFAALDARSTPLVGAGERL